MHLLKLVQTVVWRRLPMKILFSVKIVVCFHIFFFLLPFFVVFIFVSIAGSTNFLVKSCEVLAGDYRKRVLAPIIKQYVVCISFRRYPMSFPQHNTHQSQQQQ